jgi:hypothetical protein
MASNNGTGRVDLRLDDLVLTLMLNRFYQPQRLAGPPAPTDYRPTPLRGRIEDERGTASPGDLLPLYLAQLADFGATQRLVGHHTTQGHVGVERNPLPLMRSAEGRALWALGEAKAAHGLTRGSPKLRKAVKVALPLIHGLLALHNLRLATQGRGILWDR